MKRPSHVVLVITSINDATSNLVIEALNERGARIARVDPADIGPGLMFDAYLGYDRSSWSGWLRTPSRDVPLEEVRAVYYRRPGPWRFEELNQQAQNFAETEARYGLGGLLASLSNCRYVNHPADIRRADFKPTQLQVAAQVGFSVPRTLVTNDLEAARKFVTEHDPAIYKSFRGAPRAENGHVSAIWTQRINAQDLDETLSVTAHMFQEKIPKTADVRVTVIGSAVFASRITSPDNALDWRSGDWDRLLYDPIDVPDSIQASLRAYLDHFGLVFGAFDFALRQDGPFESWVFIECNPNGQWGWLPGSEAMAYAFADVLLEEQ